MIHVLQVWEVKCPRVSMWQASEMLGMDADLLGGALRRRKVRVQHAGRESVHEAKGVGECWDNSDNWKIWWIFAFEMTMTLEQTIKFVSEGMKDSALFCLLLWSQTWLLDC